MRLAIGKGYAGAGIAAVLDAESGELLGSIQGVTASGEGGAKLTVLLNQMATYHQMLQDGLQAPPDPQALPFERGVAPEVPSLLPRRDDGTETPLGIALRLAERLEDGPCSASDLTELAKYAGGREAAVNAEADADEGLLLLAVVCSEAVDPSDASDWVWSLDQSLEETRQRLAELDALRTAEGRPEAGSGPDDQEKAVAEADVPDLDPDEPGQQEGPGEPDEVGSAEEETPLYQPELASTAKPTKGRRRASGTRNALIPLPE